MGKPIGITTHSGEVKTVTKGGQVKLGLMSSDRVVVIPDDGGEDIEFAVSLSLGIDYLSDTIKPDFSIGDKVRYTTSDGPTGILYGGLERIEV